MKCPSCDSENTVKCFVAYQAGTNTGSFGGLGIDLQGDIGGFGGISSSQTLLAQSVSPPKAPGSNPLGLILLAGGVLAIILGIAYYNDLETHNKFMCVLIACLGFLSLLASIYILFIDHARLMKAHKRDLENWARQWVCLRCGTKFEVSH